MQEALGRGPKNQSFEALTKVHGGAVTLILLSKPKNLSSFFWIKLQV